MHHLLAAGKDLLGACRAKVTAFPKLLWGASELRFAPTLPTHRNTYSIQLGNRARCNARLASANDDCTTATYESEPREQHHVGRSQHVHRPTEQSCSLAKKCPYRKLWRASTLRETDALRGPTGFACTNQPRPEQGGSVCLSHLSRLGSCSTPRKFDTSARQNEVQQVTQDDDTSDAAIIPSCPSHFVGFPRLRDPETSARPRSTYSAKSHLHIRQRHGLRIVLPASEQSVRAGRATESTPA